jgi:predicted  nucleic acid-binding Zn-ribbon protein
MPNRFHLDEQEVPQMGRKVIAARYSQRYSTLAEALTESLSEEKQLATERERALEMHILRLGEQIKELKDGKRDKKERSQQG